MSCCNSYPTCQDAEPNSCEPLEVANFAQRIVVEDTAGCAKTLSTPTVKSVLVYELSELKLKWVDASTVIGFPTGSGVLARFTNTGTPVWITGTAGQALRIGSDGLPEFSFPTGWITVNANASIVSGQQIFADTTTGPFTLFLPTSPSVNSSVMIADKGGTWSTNNLTINRNGQTIEGLSEDLICNVSNKMFTLIYNGLTWKIFTV